VISYQKLPFMHILFKLLIYIITRSHSV